MFGTKLGLLLFICASVSCAHQKQHHNNDWDVLLFVQHWLPTACREYMLMHAGSHCVMPSTPSSWTVHGIWPTKTGTKGPNKCNKTWTLEPSDISSVADQLKVYWADIYQDQGFERTLWAHEWLTHGTCAAVQDQFQTPLQFFQKGIDWNKQYNITDILQKANIIPDDNKVYKMDDIHKAVTSSVGKEPYIGCFIVDEKTQIISEVRICFNKSLEVVDCTAAIGAIDLPPGQGLFWVGGRKWGSGGFGFSTNCDESLGITYPVKF